MPRRPDHNKLLWGEARYEIATCLSIQETRQTLKCLQEWSGKNGLDDHMGTCYAKSSEKQFLIHLITQNGKSRPIKEE